MTRQQAADLDEEYDLGYAAERYTHVRLRRRADYYPDEGYYNYYEDDDGRCDYFSSYDDYDTDQDLYYDTTADWYYYNWDPEC